MTSASSAIRLAEEIRGFGVEAHPRQDRIHINCVVLADGRAFYSRNAWYRYAKSIGIDARPKPNVAKMDIDAMPEGEAWF